MDKKYFPRVGDVVRATRIPTWSDKNTVAVAEFMVDSVDGNGHACGQGFASQFYQNEWDFECLVKGMPKTPGLYVHKDDWLAWPNDPTLRLKSNGVWTNLATARLWHSQGQLMRLDIAEDQS